MNILEKIIIEKRKEVADQKLLESIDELKSRPNFSRNTMSLQSSLESNKKTGIIAEYKRRSPSKGSINEMSPVAEVATDYFNGGASAVSILTDLHFFGGSLEDLISVRHLAIPLLRKDFIIDEYQVVQSKAYGADVILLIAACLTPEEVAHLSATAKNIGLNVLLEIHAENELGHLCETVDAVGINNRDLKTFTVDLNKSVLLSKKLPANTIKVAESGIDQPATINFLRKSGFTGFLMGEVFMKTNDPGNAFLNFVNELNI